MTECVVDVLEAVEVDDHDRRVCSLTLRREQRLVAAISKERAVGEVGEPVVQSLVAVLVGLAAELLRRAPDDAKDDGVKQAEPAEQQEVRRVRVACDGGSDRLVGQIELEHARRPCRRAEAERHIDLEQLTVGALVYVLGVCQMAYLRHDLTMECLGELGRGRKAAADKVLVVGVDDAAVCPRL